ncbi:hypothetical protein FPRO05_00598 [Fusarium proliferatum]|uniref:Uncharacterized protein n=1 Tax=Gibberella intermedia TaxID=948311 RepID=A0A365NN29_GIBIN|nr:hypothetical protein FPRO05_00598 [Fusarium proliferatum]
MSFTNHPLLINIYDALRGKFDAGDKTLFQMQVPTQPLQKSEFHYDGSDSNFAQMIKPVPVTEAEFRLTDSMLKLSNIVGGPNGSKLSEKYDQVLSGLISADRADEELQFLEARRDTLMTVGDFKSLQKAVNDARAAVYATEAEMAKGFTDTVAECIKLYFAQVCSMAQDSIAAVKGLNNANKMELCTLLQKYQGGTLSDEQWRFLVALQLKHVQNLNDLAEASKMLNRAQVEVSQVNGRDKGVELGVINDQIASLSVEIKKYQNMLRETDSQNFEKISDAFQGNASTPGWETLTIDSRTLTQTQSGLSCTSSANLAWSTNILSYSESGLTSFAAVDQGRTLSTENTDVKVMLSLTKVAIDRPWFNAQVLGKGTGPITSTAAKLSAGNAEDVRKLFASGSIIDTTECQLPAWTTSFLVFQDVCITLTSHTTFQRSQVQDIDNCLSSGGSLLVFRACKGDTNGNQGAGYGIKSDDKMIQVRISAPQILGWFTQISP